jgi:hypothetical protein
LSIFKGKKVTEKQTYFKVILQNIQDFKINVDGRGFSVKTKAPKN